MDSHGLSCALTADDYLVAASCIRQRAYEERRMREVMGEYCAPEYLAQLQARETANLQRALRFEQAAFATASAEART